MKDLFKTIETAIDEIGHGWTTPAKGQAMAAMVLALRPERSVEIGVYAGKGLVSLALAHKAIGYGTAIGIDPYRAEDSVEGQVNPADAEFWAKVDYEAMKGICIGALQKYQLEGFFSLVFARSDTLSPWPGIGLLRIDGNHGEQAYRDARKWAPFVVKGGFLIVDDIGWSGGATTRAAVWAGTEGGFRELYKLDDGIVFQAL